MACCRVQHEVQQGQDELARTAPRRAPGTSCLGLHRYETCFHVAVEARRGCRGKPWIPQRCWLWHAHHFWLYLECDDV